MRKKGQLTGFLQGMSFSANMGEIARLVMIQKAIETKEWEKEGFDTVKDFCKAVGGASYDTIHRKLSSLKELGAEVTSIMVSLGLSGKDVKLIAQSVSIDPATGKKVLKVSDDKAIPFNEDRLDEIQSHIDLIKEQAATAKKSEAVVSKKLDGIDKEHKKELKAMSSEIESLKAQLPKDEEDREWAEKYIEVIAKAHAQFDLALRTFAFHKKVYADPVLQAKVIGMHEEVQTRFRQFVEDFDAFITEVNE